MNGKISISTEKGSSAADAAETSRFRLRPSGFRLRAFWLYAATSRRDGPLNETHGQARDEIRPLGVRKRGWGVSSIRPPWVTAHELPPIGGTKAARCAAYSARQFPIFRKVAITVAEFFNRHILQPLRALRFL